MNEQEYIRRVRKARVSRDACTTWQSEEQYESRIRLLEAILQRTIKERDAALKEIGRMHIQCNCLPKVAGPF